MNIYVAREIWADSFSVYIRKINQGENYAHKSIALPVQYRVVTKEDEGLVPMPTLQLKIQEAQELVDALWAAGVRPTEGIGSSGSLAATQKHLEDMRHIVFKSNPIKT